jgi:RNA polymerase sigma-70 factor (ECF subfamily)
LDYVYRPKLFRFLIASLKNEADVDDCIQDVFLKVLRDACKFRGKFGIWIYLRQLAYTTAMDQFRDTRKREDVFAPRPLKVEDGAVPEAASIPTPSGVAEDPEHERSRIIDEAFAKLERLHPEKVFLLRMRVLDGASLAEMAEVVGGSAKDMKRELFKARGYLRELFLKCESESA